jgi:N-acetylmuramoyl-L-alanine amidase
MRKITEIIIHCSATPEGLEISVDIIRDWHVKQRGWSDIGYHYVIGLDGVLFDGRPIEEIGAHCLGHNTHSIGICYVGGLDLSGNPKDTRTDEQKNTLDKLLGDLKQVYPDATIHGHNEFSNKACPCFDVKAEYGL